MAEVAGSDEASGLERLVQAGLEDWQASAFLGIYKESRPVFDLLLGYDEGRGEFAGQGTPQADFDAVVARLRAYLQEKGVDAEFFGVPVQDGPEPTGVAEDGPAWPQLRAWFPPPRGTLDAMVEPLGGWGLVRPTFSLLSSLRSVEMVGGRGTKPLRTCGSSA